MIVKLPSSSWGIAKSFEIRFLTFVHSHNVQVKVKIVDLIIVILISQTF